MKSKTHCPRGVCKRRDLASQGYTGRRSRVHPRGDVIYVSQDIPSKWCYNPSTGIWDQVCINGSSFVNCPCRLTEVSLLSQSRTARYCFEEAVSEPIHHSWDCWLGPAANRCPLVKTQPDLRMQLRYHGHGYILLQKVLGSGALNWAPKRPGRSHFQATRQWLELFMLFALRTGV